MTDLGSDLYLQELGRCGSDSRLYEDAIRSLVRFQARVSASELPPYDRCRLDLEMSLFRDWLLREHLELELGEGELRQLSDVFDFLARSALGQPEVFVHRDYHSRNLMVCPADNPGILDFQDAMRGPVTYDLVSLLKDCYFKLPPGRVAELVDFYMTEASKAGIDTGNDEARFEGWFDLMGVQRHLKASGIFARLWHRDGKAGYLADVPLTLSYITDCAGKYPELDFLSALIEQRVLPALAPGAPSPP